MALPNFIPTLPLPFLSLFLPFAGASVILCVRLYHRIVFMRSGRVLNINKRVLKVSFLLFLLVNMALVTAIWLRFRSEGAVFYVYGGEGWKESLPDVAGVSIRALMQVDSLGAVSALLMGFVALVAGLRSLADARNAFSPTKAAFYLLTLCGIQGIFYSNGLFLLFFFITISQAGASGLYRGVPADKNVFWRSVWYYTSRLMILSMFLAGTVILYMRYKTDNIAVLSNLIEPGQSELLAFVLLTVPLFFLFVKRSSYVTDGGRRCFFGIRAQAAFFALFRVIFFLFGSVEGLAKIPGLFILSGLLLFLSAALFSAKERDPVKFADCMEMYMKGFMLVSLGISMCGIFGAESAARYGLSALGGMVSLWMIFLPASAALSIICCLLREEDGGGEIWRRGRLCDTMPCTCAALFLVIFVIAGLPPFVGFSAKQFLFRSANSISPFLTVALFIASMAALMTGLRYLTVLMFREGASKGAGDHLARDIEIALPMLLLFAVFVTSTVVPGRVFESVLFPSVESLVNRGHQMHILNSAGHQGGEFK